MESLNTKTNKYIKVLVGVILCMLSFNAYAEEEWDEIPLTAPWQTTNELHYSSNTASNLSVFGPDYVSDDLTYSRPYVDATYIIPKQSPNTLYAISLDVTNVNSDWSKHWKYKVPKAGKNGKTATIHFKNYWSVSINYTTINGEKKYWRINYQDGKKYLSGVYVNKTTACIENNACIANWGKDKYWSDPEIRHKGELDSRDIIIGWKTNGNLYISGFWGKSKAELNDVAYINAVSIGVGCSSLIDASISMVKQTAYGAIKPLLEEAIDQIDAGDTWNAINSLNYIIDDCGYKNAYFWRAYAYAKIGYHKSAIEDFDMAIMNSPTQTESELAYYYRGISKFNLDDVEGAISDFKMGGIRGQAIIKEIDLENPIINIPSNNPLPARQENKRTDQGKPSLNKF